MGRLSQALLVRIGGAPPSGFDDQVASQAQRKWLCSRAVLVSVLQARARARAKRTAAAGSKADEAMPEGGQMLLRRASTELFSG